MTAERFDDHRLSFLLLHASLGGKCKRIGLELWSYGWDDLYYKVLLWGPVGIKCHSKSLCTKEEETLYESFLLPFCDNMM